MSRIAEVLRRARIQCAGDAVQYDGAERAPGSDGADVTIPWTLDQIAGSGTPPDDPNSGDTVEHVAAKALAMRRGRAVNVVPIGNRRRAAERDIVRYGDVIRRRWRIGVATFLVVVFGVSTGAFFEAPVYRATGLIEVRPEMAGAGPVDTLFTVGRVPSEELETQFGILKSSTLAERTIESMIREDVAAGRIKREPGDDPHEWPVPGGRISATSLQSTLVINPLRGSRLVKVSFDADRRDTAARVVNAVFDTYMAMRMEEARASVDWLQQQQRNAQQRLEDSERQLQDYLRTHGLPVMETGKGETALAINQRLQALHEELTKARADRIDKQALQEQIALQPARGLDSPVVQSLSVRLADLRREHARLASAFHEEYPAVKALTNQIAEMQRALDGETALVASRVRREFQASRRREMLVEQELNAQSAALNGLEKVSAAGSGYESLKREVVTNQGQFAALNQKLKEVSISAALKAANVGIVDRARLPDAPYGSTFTTTVSLAVMVGLVLGAGGMFLREHLDTSMRSREDVEVYLGVPTLAAIPAAGRSPDALPAVSRVRWLRRGPQRSAPSESPLAEAFAALRTKVLLDEDTQARALLVTSATPAEGKTTVSVNLAVSLARLDHRVLLIDANMRQPQVNAALTLERGPGLFEYLTSDLDWCSCVRPSAQPNLDVMAGGSASTSPADLLSRPRMQQLIPAARQQYDFVVIDSPAFLPHPADVQSLATLADSVLVTVRLGSTPREAVSLALSQLPRVSGVVLNQFDSRGLTALDRDTAVEGA